MSPVFHPSAMIFSAKSFLAAMLALYIALSLGLESPSWAIITAYAVAQPRAGAVLSKGFYRMAGTIAGAAMSVFLVPPLVDAPELLSAAVACWLGLCVFLAAIDRTPRSYMFVLAGYSTCIIVFPSVSHPDAIFNIAVLRVQEIGLGVICSSLIHATILPSSSTRLLLSRLDLALSDAARWTADTLSDTRPEALDGARRRLAMAVNEMHDILIHAGFESDNHSRQRRLYRALLLQMERLLPLSEALDDRILELRRTDAMTPEVAILLADVRAWVSATAVSRAPKGAKANQLRERCAGLEPTVLPKMSWQDALRLNLLARLSDLIAVYDNCIALRCAIDSWPCDDNKQCQVNSLAKSAPRTIDRNYYGALAAGASTSLTLFVGCALWIASGWDGGANAVMMAGVFFSIYSSLGNPALALKNKYVGVAIRLLLGAVYVLAILPSIDGFPLLAASLAPVLFVSGVLLTVPLYSPLAFNLIIGVLGPAIISERFSSDFAGYLNSGLATLTGIIFSLLIMRLVQSIWLEDAPKRLLKAGWKEIARGKYQTSTRWRTRMAHRIALLTVHTTNECAIDADATASALRDLKIGLSLAELAKLPPLVPAGAQMRLSSILEGASHHYRSMVKGEPNPPSAALLERIDRALHAGTGSTDAVVQRSTTLALVSVRRNIFPQAAPLQ